MKNFFKVVIGLSLIVSSYFIILNNKKETLILLGSIILWGIIFTPIMVYLENKKRKSA
jgi:hypothetical protein